MRVAPLRRWSEGVLLQDGADMHHALREPWALLHGQRGTAHDTGARRLLR